MDEPANCSDTVNDSALDVVSCGLGAAVLLFLVLSVVRATPTVSGSVDQFICFYISLPEDKNSLVVPVIQPPNASRPIVIPLQGIDSITGQLNLGSTVAGVNSNEMISLRAGAPNYHLLGFSVSGERTAVSEGSKRREFRVVIQAPIAGEWGFSARYFNADPTVAPPDYNKSNLEIETSVQSRDQTLPMEAEKIRFSKATKLRTIKVKEKKKQ